MAPTNLPYPIAEFTAAAGKVGVPVDRTHPGAFTSAPKTFTDANGVARSRLEYGATQLGCVVVTGTPCGVNDIVGQRDLSWAKAPSGRTFLHVQMPLLPAFLLAARAGDIQLLGRLSVEDPWTALTHVAGASIYDRDARSLTKDPFFTFVTGKPIGRLADDPFWATHPVVATFEATFTRAHAWLNSGRSRYEQWKLLNAAAFAMQADVTGAVLANLASLPGDAVPVHIEQSLPVLEVDEETADAAAQLLESVLAAHVRSQFHIAGAPGARPRVWVVSSDRLDG